MVNLKDAVLLRNDVAFRMLEETVPQFILMGIVQDRIRVYLTKDRVNFINNFEAI